VGVSGQVERARHHFQEFDRMFAELDDEAKNSDPEVQEQRNMLARALGVQ